MGLAKYLEDDMEIWQERNHDRLLPLTNVAFFSLEKHGYARAKSSVAYDNNPVDTAQYSHADRGKME